MSVEGGADVESGWSRVVGAAALGGGLGLVGGTAAAFLVSVAAGVSVLGDGLVEAFWLVVVYASIGSIIGSLLGCILGAVVGLALGAFRIERHAPVVSVLVGVAFSLAWAGDVPAAGAVTLGAGFGLIGWVVGSIFAAQSARAGRRTGGLRARFC